MVERIKTIVLYGLVLLSFYLTWAIGYGLPKYEYISPSDYEERKSIGRELKMQELIRPTQVIFHSFIKGDTAENEAVHRVALPTMTSYSYIIGYLPKWLLSDVRLSHIESTAWEETALKREGVEIRYEGHIPNKVLTELFNFRENDTMFSQGINRIWLYREEGNSVKALLFSDSTNEVLEAKTSVSGQDLDLYLQLGSSAYRYEKFSLNEGLTTGGPRYGSGYPGYIYLPQNSISFPKYVWSYKVIAPEEMIDMLFVDPSIVQEIQERDNSLIYHDGTKGMRVDPLRRYISFDNPPFLSTDREASINEMLHASISFVNQHGGWSKFSYNLQKWPNVVSVEGDHTFEYQPYYQYFAIYGNELTDLNVRVELNNEVVTGYDRPLIVLDEKKNSGSIEVMSGADLISYLFLQKQIELSQIKNIQLVYRPVFNAELSEITLELNWAITFNNNDKVEFLDATISKQPTIEEGVNNGLE